VGVELIEHPITVIVTEHVSRSSAFNHEGVPQIITDIIFNEVVGAAPPQINAVGSTRSVVVERSVMKIAATHFVPVRAQHVNTGFAQILDLHILNPAILGVADFNAKSISPSAFPDMNQL